MSGNATNAILWDLKVRLPHLRYRSSFVAYSEEVSRVASSAGVRASASALAVRSPASEPMPQRTPDGAEFVLVGGGDVVLAVADHHGYQVCR